MSISQLHKQPERLGLMTGESWDNDPKHLLFTLARYKFVARMLAGRSHVLEVGCADAFGTRIVQQAVSEVTAIDLDPLYIADANDRMNPNWPFHTLVHDVRAPVPGVYDAAYALDVLEHIIAEDAFLRNIISALTSNGVLIIGMPSLESQIHASLQSKAAHVNCKSGEDLRHTMERYFGAVFIFSMNDEVVHTGFYPMAHYLFALCCQPAAAAA